MIMIWALRKYIDMLYLMVNYAVLNLSSDLGGGEMGVKCVHLFFKN